MSYGGILFHQRLVSDRARTNAYRQAIRAIVKEGDVVLDIGTGSGILALLACQAGAGKVYAVDNANIINVARGLAEENGYADRVIFLKDDIRSLQLPEKVDLITSELISKAVIGQRMEELTEICRERFLKPGGKIIPQEVELRVAPVSLGEAAYQSLVFPSGEVYDLSFETANKLARNALHSIRAQVNYLSAPQVGYVLDSSATHREHHPDFRLEYIIDRAGVLHGFIPWFRALLAPGVVLENPAPGLPSWDNLFLPIQERVSLEPGMILRLSLRAQHPSGLPVTWEWKTEISVLGSSGSAEPVASYSQSSFADSILEESSVLKLRPSYRPALTSLGEQLRFILDLSDGSLTVDEIAMSLIERFPADWKTVDEARDFVQASIQSLYTDGLAT